MNIEFNRWRDHRIFLLSTFIVIASFLFRYIDREMISEEWMARLVLYALGIFALGEGVGGIATSLKSSTEAKSKEKQS